MKSCYKSKEKLFAIYKIIKIDTQKYFLFRLLKTSEAPVLVSEEMRVLQSCPDEAGDVEPIEAAHSFTGSKWHQHSNKRLFVRRRIAALQLLDDVSRHHLTVSPSECSHLVLLGVAAVADGVDVVETLHSEILVHLDSPSLVHILSINQLIH